MSTSTITVEIHSQGNAKKVHQLLDQLPCASNIEVVEAATACTNVRTKKDSPLLRIYFADEHQLEEVLKALAPLNTEYRIEVAAQLYKSLPRLPKKI